MHIISSQESSDVQTRDTLPSQLQEAVCRRFAAWPRYCTHALIRPLPCLVLSDSSANLPESLPVSDRNFLKNIAPLLKFASENRGTIPLQREVFSSQFRLYHRRRTPIQPLPETPNS